MAHAGKNNAPLQWRNISASLATKVRDQYNAESTYNDFANNQAFEHLKTLSTQAGMLAAHPALADHPDAPHLPGAVAEAVRLHNAKHIGDVVEGPSGVGSQLYVKQIHNALVGLTSHPDAGVSELATQAKGSAEGYMGAFTPAHLDTNQKNKKTSGEEGISVVVDPEYRKHIFADPKTTADGKYAKTAMYEANKKAKGYVKPKHRKPEVAE